MPRSFPSLKDFCVSFLCDHAEAFAWESHPPPSHHQQQYSREKHHSPWHGRLLTGAAMSRNKQKQLLDKFFTMADSVRSIGPSTGKGGKKNKGKKRRKSSAESGGVQENGMSGAHGGVMEQQPDDHQDTGGDGEYDQNTNDGTNVIGWRDLERYYYLLDREGLSRSLYDDIGGDARDGGDLLHGSESNTSIQIHSARGDASGMDMERPLLSYLPSQVAQMVCSELCARQRITFPLLLQLSPSGITHLNLSGCGRVSNDWMLLIRGMPLLSLNLSHCQIDDNGIFLVRHSKRRQGNQSPRKRKKGSRGSKMRKRSMSTPEEFDHNNAERETYAISSTLTSLNLNYVQGITLDGIQCISKVFPLLKILSLEGCNSVSNKCLDVISSELGSTLQALNLRKCNNITCHGIRQLCHNLQHIEVLNLGDCPKLSEDVIKILTEAEAPTKSLTHFDISGLELQVRTEHAECLSHFSRLRHLNLYANGELQTLDMIPGLSSTLSSLNISRFKLSSAEQLRKLSSLSRLQCLNMCGIRTQDGSLSREMIDVFHGIHGLVALDISHTDIEDEAMLSIAELQCLEKLDISHCQEITDIGFVLFAHLPSLTELHARSLKHIDSCGWEHLCKLHQLKTLGVSGSLHRADDDDDNVDNSDERKSAAKDMLKLFEGLSKNACLEWLDVSNCNLFLDESLVALCSMNTLSFVDMSNTMVKDDGIRNGLSKMVHLTDLHMKGCAFERPIGCHLRDLVELEQLDLTSVKAFGDDDLGQVANSLTKLKAMALSDTSVTSRGIITHISKMSNITSLDLYDLSADDIMIRSLRRLSNLNSLGLSQSSALSQRSFDLLHSEMAFSNLIYLRLRNGSSPEESFGFASDV